MASNDFLSVIKDRRTYYSLKKESPISNERIQEIIRTTVTHVPSSFNVQSARLVLLLGDEHDKLWEIVREVLKAIVPAEHFAPTSQKIDLFKGAYGTILFFTHTPSIDKQKADYPSYADKFPTWAVQSLAMHQIVLWAALEKEGLGANLQHYNPIIDQKVQSQWGIPADWELNAQLVFGVSNSEAGPKDFKPLEERFKVFGA